VSHKNLLNSKCVKDIYRSSTDLRRGISEVISKESGGRKNKYIIMKIRGIFWNEPIRMNEEDRTNKTEITGMKK
jgi:hypothetical protein